MLSLIVFFVGAVFVQAEQLDCIIIHMKADNKVFVPIKEHPKIVFENQMLAIGTEQYLISNVSKYTFGNYAQGIESETIVRNGVQASKDGHVYVQMGNSGSILKVYSVDGIELNVNVLVNGDGMADINLSKHPAGVYLLSIDGETLKVQKR